MENQKEMFENEQQAKMSPEEMAQRRMEMMRFYETQMPLMKLQKEYEVMAADIEEARARRIRAVMMIGQMTSPPSENAGVEPESEEAPSTGNRKLKTKQ